MDASAPAIAAGRSSLVDREEGTAVGRMSADADAPLTRSPAHDAGCGDDAATNRRRRPRASLRGSSRRRNIASSSARNFAFLLLLLHQLADTIEVARAQDYECSCSPRVFMFRLALSAACPPLPPPFPPNDVFGAGVQDYTCTIGPEPLPTGSQEVTSEDTDVALTLNSANEEETGEVEEGGSRRQRGRRALQSMCEHFPELPACGGEIERIAAPEGVDVEEVPDIEWSSVNFTTSSLTTDTSDSVPVSIYSIQFLEVDTYFNVINQDSSNVRGIDFVNGDVFNYTSISAKRPGVIPGGMNMVLRGVNAAGDPVRNVFTITYTNDCGVQTFQDGDAIGWVVFVSLESAFNHIMCTELECSFWRCL